MRVGDLYRLKKDAVGWIRWAETWDEAPVEGDKVLIQRIVEVGYSVDSKTFTSQASVFFLDQQGREFGSDPRDFLAAVEPI